MRSKKMIELADVLSIEEADDVTKEDVNLEDVVILVLSYGDVFVNGKYTSIKKKWLNYKKKIEEDSSFINASKN